MRARVLVRPKAGILDPQGQAVERALPALGFQGVSSVHVGRMIELEVEDSAQLPDMCERLLSYASPLHLYAEELEASSGRHLGNFPQAFTHLALINAVTHVINAQQGG